jgi:hypothetical protein
MSSKTFLVLQAVAAASMLGAGCEVPEGQTPGAAGGSGGGDIVEVEVALCAIDCASRSGALSNSFRARPRSHEQHHAPRGRTFQARIFVSDPGVGDDARDRLRALS